MPIGVSILSFSPIGMGCSLNPSLGKSYLSVAETVFRYLVCYLGADGDKVAVDI